MVGGGGGGGGGGREGSWCLLSRPLFVCNASFRVECSELRVLFKNAALRKYLGRLPRGSVFGGI